MQQLTRRRRDIEADIVQAYAAHEAAVSRHDVGLVVGPSAWIDQPHTEPATLPPPQCGV